jgi:hypothetical protein
MFAKMVYLPIESGGEVQKVCINVSMLKGFGPHTRWCLTAFIIDLVILN